MFRKRREHWGAEDALRSLAVGTEAVWYSVMGKPHCRRKGTDLTYRVISVEQGKPVSLLERGSEAARPIDGERATDRRKSECRSVMERISVASSTSTTLPDAKAG
jgi:hypothetical protein